jgi:uncharacterized XkdX family phage protein
MMLVVNFEFVKDKYDAGLWTKEQVQGAVKMNKITADEYKTITGDDYAIDVASTPTA